LIPIHTKRFHGGERRRATMAAQYDTVLGTVALGGQGTPEGEGGDDVTIDQGKVSAGARSPAAPSRACCCPSALPRRRSPPGTRRPDRPRSPEGYARAAQGETPCGAKARRRPAETNRGSNWAAPRNVEDSRCARLLRVRRPVDQKRLRYEPAARPARREVQDYARRVLAARAHAPPLHGPPSAMFSSPARKSASPAGLRR
jgi:hypothetical protein